ncbi:probable salivary secreted peptide [Scaptodrosophila lebanonensis]|uniref:Probable salivary secreted peptide n=1 Tax=Drosophila lebanonensis TaxID=7225 RepID=A0A6J2UN16_DROLE|nr:probable salivary secreted peptide [Scaptodrosophila lebanonensis]
MKVSLLALLIVVASTAPVSGSGRGRSHSITWGSRSFRDTHLQRVIITEKSKFLRVVTRDYVFEQKIRPRMITQIVVTDQVRGGDGGYAQLKAGGPHATFARIHFKSQRNKGFSFIVDIYGI